MGIRETLNENPKLAAIGTVIIMAGSLIYIGMRYFHPHPSASQVPSKSYYCNEDGSELFIDSAANIPPFDHNGKTAVRAFLFKTADGRVFIQRLEKFDDTSKERIHEQIIKNGMPAMQLRQMYPQGIMVKRPSDKEWLQANSPAAAELMIAKSPWDGSKDVRPVSVDEDAHPQPY